MDNHKKISFIKSGLRLIGCGLGFWFVPDRQISAVFALLFIAEIIGVIEEMVV